MQEVEVKVLEIDPFAIRSKLEALGATPVFQGYLHALFYDLEGFPLTQKKQVLRLRKEGEQTLLTYKKSISREGAKVMDERQTEVADFEAMKSILTGLGYRAMGETYKHREVYRHPEVEFVIDRYKGDMGHIPPFMEIETTDIDSLNKWIDALGIPREKALSWDTYDLVQYYGRSSLVPVEKTQAVRAAVLRPGWDPADCIVEDDHNPAAIHIAFDFGDEPVGVASIYPQPLADDSGTGWRLRQMGVLPSYHRKGVGRAIVLRAIAEARAHQASYLWCDAREVAFLFYENLGFTYIGEPFDIPHIGPHRRMRLQL